MDEFTDEDGFGIGLPYFIDPSNAPGEQDQDLETNDNSMNDVDTFDEQFYIPEDDGFETTADSMNDTNAFDQQFRFPQDNGFETNPNFTNDGENPFATLDFHNDDDFNTHADFVHADAPGEHSTDSNDGSFEANNSVDVFMADMIDLEFGNFDAGMAQQQQAAPHQGSQSWDHMEVDGVLDAAIIQQLPGQSYLLQDQEDVLAPRPHTQRLTMVPSQMQNAGALNTQHPPVPLSPLAGPSELSGRRVRQDASSSSLHTTSDMMPIFHNGNLVRVFGNRDALTSLGAATRRFGLRVAREPPYDDTDAFLQALKWHQQQASLPNHDLSQIHRLKIPASGFERSIQDLASPSFLYRDLNLDNALSMLSVLTDFQNAKVPNRPPQRFGLGIVTCIKSSKSPDGFYQAQVFVTEGHGHSTDEVWMLRIYNTDTDTETFRPFKPDPEMEEGEYPLHSPGAFQRDAIIGQIMPGSVNDMQQNPRFIGTLSNAFPDGTFNLDQQDEHRMLNQQPYEFVGYPMPALSHQFNAAQAGPAPPADGTARAQAEAEPIHQDGAEPPTPATGSADGRAGRCNYDYSAKRDWYPNHSDDDILHGRDGVKREHIAGELLLVIAEKMSTANMHKALKTWRNMSSNNITQMIKKSLGILNIPGAWKQDDPVYQAQVADLVEEFNKRREQNNLRVYRVKERKPRRPAGSRKAEQAAAAAAQASEAQRQTDTAAQAAP